jgi:hypothetical protein
MRKNTKKFLYLSIAEGKKVRNVTTLKIKFLTFWTLSIVLFLFTQHFWGCALSPSSGKKVYWVGQKDGGRFQSPQLFQQRKFLGRNNIARFTLKWQGPRRKQRVQQLYFCMCIRWRGNVFTELLPSNDSEDTHAQTAWWFHKATFIFSKWGK